MGFLFALFGLFGSLGFTGAIGGTADDDPISPVIPDDTTDTDHDTSVDDELPDDDDDGDTPHDDHGGDTPDDDHGGDTPHDDHGGDTPDDDHGGDTPHDDHGGDTPDDDHGGDTPHDDHGGDTPHDDHGGDTPTIQPPDLDADQATIDAYVAAVRAQPEIHVHDDDDDRGAEHMAAMELAPRDEATHIAIADGDWFDPSTWYNGIVPGDDAKVLIPEGINVQYGDISDARLFTVRVDGELDFATDMDSQMVLDTMLVSPTGSLVIGTEIDPIAEDVSVNLIIANNGAIDVDWDPTLMSRGIISHGETSIHGAYKDAHEKVSEDPAAGDTSIQFDTLPEGWAVGDTIVIAGTAYDGYKWDNAIGGRRHYEPEDEVRVISAIEGGEVFFDTPLEYDHFTPREDLKASVANYSRNVTVETEDAETAEISERGHVMFMHSDDVDVRYAAFVELGRTDKSELSQQASDFDVIEPDSNVQGRYSLHLHRTGIEDSENPAMIVGNAVWGSPGWGYVHHDSHAVMDGNASYDTFGAGYVAETGNETGAWTDNIAIFAQGTDWGEAKNTSIFNDDTFDTAKGGHGFWFQGRLLDATDNVAASVNTGYVYFHRDGDDRMIDFDASVFDYPDALHLASSVTADDAPILNFAGNETFAARQGLHVVKANPNQGHDVWSHLDDFTAWSVLSGAHLEYTSHYLLSNFDVIGKTPTQFSTPDAGIILGNNTFEIVIRDTEISSFETGASLRKEFAGDTQGSIEDHNFILINTNIDNVDNPFRFYDDRYDRVLETSDLAPQTTPSLSLDPLIYQQGPEFFSFGGVSITGQKTDSIGTHDFPGGTDTFYITPNNMVNLLEENGYWTTSDGQAYMLHDIYMTDRATGDIFYETHPIYFAEDVIPQLGSPFFAFSQATHNGMQDIVTTGDTEWAGDVELGTAIPVDEILPEPQDTSFDEPSANTEALDAMALWDTLALEPEDTMPQHGEHEETYMPEFI